MYLLNLLHPILYIINTNMNKKRTNNIIKSYHVHSKLINSQLERVRMGYIFLKNNE